VYNGLLLTYIQFNKAWKICLVPDWLDYF
jgi:hypothetical protein